MKKIEYVARSLSRSTKNFYENYVVNAIYQKVNNNQLEIETQKSVKTESGQNYRLDFYLPQLKLVIEVDEPFHSKQEEDYQREQLIKRQAVKHSLDNLTTIERIKISNGTTLE